MSNRADRVYEREACEERRNLVKRIEGEGEFLHEEGDENHERVCCGKRVMRGIKV